MSNPHFCLPHDVYTVFAKKRGVVYVGCSKDYGKRLANFRARVDFWADDLFIFLESFSNYRSAREMERHRIYGFQPSLNTDHKGAPPPVPTVQPADVRFCYWEYGAGIADPKAPKYKNKSAYQNWRAKGFPGLRQAWQDASSGDDELAELAMQALAMKNAPKE